MTDATLDELVQLTQRLLDCIAAADWPAYQALCDPTLTAFEPEARGQLVSGLGFHKFYFDLGPGKGSSLTTLCARTSACWATGPRWSATSAWSSRWTRRASPRRRGSKKPACGNGRTASGGTCTFTVRPTEHDTPAATDARITSRFSAVWHCLVLQAVTRPDVVRSHCLEYQAVPHPRTSNASCQRKLFRRPLLRVRRSCPRLGMVSCFPTVSWPFAARGRGRSMHNRQLPASARPFPGRLVLLLVCLACVPGCGPSGSPLPAANSSGGPPSAESAKKGLIGFSALTLKNPFFSIIADNLTREAQRNGYEVVVSDAERDVNSQAKQIDNLIVRKATAIVLNPADRVAIGPAVKRANEAGIPVFTCDLECVAEGVKIAGHVGTDNYQGGQLAGQAMIEALGEAGGKVLIIHFKQANSCVMRVKGFREVIDKYNRDRTSGRIEMVAELEGGGLRDEGFRATADALQAHPDLAGVFAINDPSALGAWTALKQANKQDQVKLIGFDGQQEGKLAIKDGKIYADPIQFPEKMGVITVQNILKYLDGEPFEANQLIPTELYRQADALERILR